MSNLKNDGDVDIQRRPYTFEDAVNCLIETFHETQNQIRDMKECFQAMIGWCDISTHFCFHKSIRRQENQPVRFLCQKYFKAGW